MPQSSSTARSSSATFQRRPKACATLPPASTRLGNESSLRLCVSRLLSGVCCETATSEAPRLRMSCYPETGGWGYYNFNHHEPKAMTASVRPKGECAYCHMASAKKDDVWTQFYPMLDEIAKKFGG
jgi:hypothetical protein